MKNMGNDRHAAMILACMIFILSIQFWCSPAYCMDMQRDMVDYLSLSPNEQKIVYFRKNKIFVVNAETGRLLHWFDNKYDFSPVMIMPDNKHLLMQGSWDSSTKSSVLEMVDAVSGARIRSFSGKRVISDLRIAASPDGSKVAAANDNKIIQVWDTKTGSLLQEIEIKSKHSVKISAISFSSDGSQLIAAGTNVWVWDMSTGNLTYEYQVPENSHDIAISPDGSRVAFLYSDGSLPMGACVTAAIYSLKEKRILATLSPPFANAQKIMFFPNGDKLATADKDGEVRLWDAWIGKLLALIQTEKELTSFALSTDGRRLLTGAYGQKIQLWDIEKQVCLRTYDDLDMEFMLQRTAAVILARVEDTKFPAARQLREIMIRKPILRKLSGKPYTYSHLRISRIIKSGKDMQIKEGDVIKAFHNGLYGNMAQEHAKEIKGKEFVFFLYHSKENEWWINSYSSMEVEKLEEMLEKAKIDFPNIVPY